MLRAVCSRWGGEKAASRRRAEKKGEGVKPAAPAKEKNAEPGAGRPE